VLGYKVVMTIRRRTGASRVAALGAVAFLTMGAPSCQRPPTVAPAAPAVGIDPSNSKAPPTVRTNFDRAIAILEERTGERLALALGPRDYAAVYPAWLPDNRLVVPGQHGVTIVEPRSGTATAIAAKGERAVVSPDGKTMAIASSGTIELLDVSSGESLQQLEASLDDNDEDAIQFSPDSRLLAFAMKDGAITGRLLALYDVAKRASRGALELAAVTQRPAGITAKLSAPPEPNDAVASFSLRSERIIATLSSGATALWDTSSLELLLLLRGAKDDADPRDRRALLSEDGSYAAAWTPVEAPASARNKVSPPSTGATPRGVIHAERRWTPLLLDARRGEVVMRLEDKQCPPFGIAMHPREPLLAVGSVYPGFCLWDLTKRKVKQRFRIPSATPKEAASAGLMLRLAAKMSPKMDLPIEHVTFDPSGELLTLSIAHLGGIVVRLADGSVSDGSLSKDSRPEDFPGGRSAATSPDRSMVAGSGTDMRVWDSTSGRVLRRMGQHEKHAALAWTADAITIVGVEGTVVRFRTGTGELAERRPRPSGFDDVKTVSNGAGTLVMLSSRPTGLRAMHLDETGKVVPLAWKGVADGILAAAASGNARRVAVSASDEVAVFDASTGAALRTFEPRGPSSQASHAPSDVALDDDGQLLAAVVQDAPRLWEVATGREIPLLPGDCTGVKFQPKTRFLVGSCRDKVRVWDGQSGALIAAVDSGDLPEGLFFDVSGARIAQLGVKYLTLLDGRTLAPLSRTESTLPTWTAAFSPSGRFVAVGVQNGDGIEFYRAADGKRVARLQMWPNDEAWIVRTEQGQVEVLGDVERIRQALECRVGKVLFPIAACERFLVKGLLAQLLSERMSDTP
jgi:WD40 repeat protein